jgi:adenylosuccinate lyase
MSKVWSDDNTFDLWLKVEIAASQAWTELGVVPRADMEKLRNALFDRATYDRIFEETRHDLVSFTRAVSESLGPESRWIHHGLTSNDVKDTSLGMQMAQSMDIIDKGVVRLMEVLQRRATEFIDTPCIGRSHGIHAEPMSFGLKLAMWWDEMRRNRERLAGARSRVAVCMLSGPVGTFAGVPPEIEESVARQLELSPAPVSNQVIQRDRHAEFVQTLALVAASLDKIATEIRALQRTEIGEVQEPFGTPGFVTKGSSSMPHKRNPELSERVCGLARVVRANSLVALENVALWHERDISHSSAERVILPDSALAVDYMIHLMTGIIDGMSVFPDRMMRNMELTRGLVFSPRVMLALVEAGVDRKAAYDTVQQCAMRSWDEGLDFRDIVRSEPAVRDALAESEIEPLFDYAYYLQHVRHSFKRLGFEIPDKYSTTAGSEPGK